MKRYENVPGRGLNTKEAISYRLDYLAKKDKHIPLIADSNLNPNTIKYNIESLIGSVEIPVGLAGPLLFNDGKKQENFFAVMGTLEGALLASVNRGSKAISLSDGFNAKVLYQKMMRSPMFLFNNLNECFIFKSWIERHFNDIKSIAEQYSNHAKLQSIDAIIVSRAVHLTFVFTTGDASGQNMTTSCTWQAVLWIERQFVNETACNPIHITIEGNGASDKKASSSSMSKGRGIHVVAECELSDKVIERVLRTTSDDLTRCFNHSKNKGLVNGMIGSNVNIANAIAAIFVATGQDLASIHESSLGVLHFERTEKGLYCSLNLTSLVIGSIGGGTHLPKQKEALQMMDCYGVNKVQRFAKHIAGFALALEISTSSAIVGGQFAKAHERLGRNKPVNWLLKSEINKSLISKCLNGELENKELVNVQISNQKRIENGIIINLTNRINKKLTGFVPISTTIKNNLTNEVETKTLLLKSKPLDTEVIKGLHYMAANIDPKLADLLFKYQSVLEYQNCHLKEIEVYEALHKSSFDSSPHYYGKQINTKREIYIFLQEFLKSADLEIINAENTPTAWTKELNQSVILSIHQLHQFFSKHQSSIPSAAKTFEPWKAKPLYQKFAQVLIKEYEDTALARLTFRLLDFIEELETEHSFITTSKTLIHNDFNARNVAIRKNGKVCIYDWELAMLNFPHRDIVEWLCFALPLDFDKPTGLSYLKYHFSLQSNVTWEEWKKGYSYAIKEFLVTRATFYLTGKILMDYPFAERVFQNGFRLLEVIEEN